MSKLPYDIIKTMLITEKSAVLKEQRKYAFKVNPKCSKLEVADAIEAIYGVKVKSVNVINYDGKLKRLGRTAIVSRRAQWKKAIVTLAEGSIELA